MLQLVDSLDKLGHTDILLVIVTDNSCYKYSLAQLKESHNVADGLIVE